ncbi:MAG: hypothetical protein H7Z41_14545 [Cytophagales bacterium]|nr:hypothetical protein [Armatimonadota bacterium]
MTPAAALVSPSKEHPAPYRVSEMSPVSKSALSTPASAVVHLLRAALRQESAGKTAAAARAIDALIARLQGPLLQYCDGLARQSAGSRTALATDRRVDGEDLAQEAWTKALRYIAGSGGDRIADDDHLQRLLRCAAKTLFLDRVSRGAAPRAIVELDAPANQGAYGESGERSLIETLAAPLVTGPVGGAASPAGLFFQDERYAPLIEQLFTDEAGFHRAYRRKHQRRPRQYQAFVLYQFGLFFRDEAATPSGGAGEGAVEMGHLIERYAALLGIPKDTWQAVSEAALASAALGPAPTDTVSDATLDEPLLAVVNERCGTNIRAANMLAVLRYEMNQFVEGRKEGTHGT